MRRLRHLAAGMLACALAAWSAATVAHTFWIEPSRFAVAVNERIGVGLCLGEDLESRPVPRDPSRIVSFSSIGPAGRQSVPGLNGSDPAGVERFTVPGDYVIAYESNHAHTTQPARQFEEYLFEVGLEEIAAARHKRGDAGRPVREAYSRHAKALVGVGERARPARDRRVGLRLELVLDPRGPQDAPDRRSLHLFYLGRPLGGALVTADSLGGPAPHTQQARTDSQGRASFRLHPGERWRINAVHMVRGGRDLGAEWESLWASLSFELTQSAELPRDDRAGRCDLDTRPSKALVSAPANPRAAAAR